MKQLEIKYRPISFIPLYRTVTGSFPDNWGEITERQLTAIAQLYKKNISEVGFISKMTGISKLIINRCDDYERYKLMEYLEFIGERKAHHKFIIPVLSAPFSLLRSPFSVLRAPCPLLHAPSPKLKGLTFGQFIFADSYFSSYQLSNDESDLNKFIAALYLERGIKFSENCINENHLKIAKTNIYMREAIVINWQLIHEWLSLAYPLIFQRREELTRNPEPATSDSSPWIKIFQNFVGDDILHDEEWANKPINTIFQYMTRKYKENARKK